MANPLAENASNVTDATIRKHIRQISSLKAALETASGEYRASVKAAKSDGVNTAELLSALEARKREPEELILNMRTRLRYLELVNMPVRQTDLFDDLKQINEAADSPESDEHVAWEARESGAAAGAAGEPKENNRFQVGTLRHQAWHSGWMEGQAQLVKSSNAGAKKASTRRARAPANAH